MRVNPYDEVQYPSRAQPEMHPDHLRLVGHLFGLAPAPAERCRLLEIGCANGGNLLPMAEALPGSEFYGIDLADSAIALTPARWAVAVGPRPRAPGHARLAARAGNRVTTLRHQSVVLTRDEQSVVVHLDGTLDRAELRARSGVATVEAALASLASNGLLVC